MKEEKINNTYCVIMAGGIGSRFWPMSTAKFPKQFHDALDCGRTLIQLTYDRLLKITSNENIFVITDKNYAELVQEQLPELEPQQIISEPLGMNTAPCALYSALKIYKKDADAQILLCPSDHLILDEDKFVKNVSMILEKDSEEKGLYTLGIEPTRPDTGYGYIQYITDENPIKKVKTFTEKPNKELALQFIQSGDFLWNSGIFIWSAKTILKAFKKHLPEMYSSLYSVYDSLNTEKEVKKIRKVYPTLTRSSIDVGVMEKSKNVYVLPSRFGWSDLGSWTSLYENKKHDKNENAVSKKFIKTYNSSGNIIHTENDKAIVIDSLNDYIVVDTKKALLICPLSKDQEVKNYVNDLKLSKGEKFV